MVCPLAHYFYLFRAMVERQRTETKYYKGQKAEIMILLILVMKTITYKEACKEKVCTYQKGD